MFSMAKMLQTASSGLRHFCVQNTSYANPFQSVNKLLVSPLSGQPCNSSRVLQSLSPVSSAAASFSASSLLTSKLLLPSSLFNGLSSMKALHTSSACAVNTFLRMHIMGPRQIKRKKNPLGYDIPARKGVVLKTVIKKPRKPNSANRKCVLVRLSNGKEMTAFVPGEGHTLQEHNTVLVVPKRLRDTPGVKIRCVRGELDLGHVVKRVQS